MNRVRYFKFFQVNLDFYGLHSNGILNSKLTFMF